MSCNTCAKSFGVFCKENGCPGCGFSYCSKCLNNKIFLSKLNAEVKVCAKCKRNEESKEKQIIQPPDAYYKRILNIPSNSDNSVTAGPSNIDQQIQERLLNLKHKEQKNTEDEIRSRLQNIKGEIPSVSDAELHERLAKLRGVPNIPIEDKKLVMTKDKRSEQEQADDLLKQYLNEIHIDNKYNDEFSAVVNDMEKRLQNLKGNESTNTPSQTSKGEEVDDEVMKIVEKKLAITKDTRTEQEQADDLLKKYLYETHIDNKYNDEFSAVVNDMEKRLHNIKGNESTNTPSQTSKGEEVDDDEVKKIVEKIKAESMDERDDFNTEEFPFCEICNEDATRRCLGCKYLFCKRCFLEHRDDDDGCDKYEIYSPPRA